MGHHFCLKIIINQLVLFVSFLVKQTSQHHRTWYAFHLCGQICLTKDLDSQKPLKPSALCHWQQRVLGEALTQAYR